MKRIVFFLISVFFLVTVSPLFAHNEDVLIALLQKILENQKENQKRIGIQPFSLSQVSVLDLANTPIKNRDNQRDESLKAFSGGFTDGRYGYFVPYRNGDYFGKVVRVDLLDFKTVDVLDLTTADPELKGFVDGFTDGKYGYFVSYFIGTCLGKVARVDLADFKTIKVLDLANTPIKNADNKTDSYLKGFMGGFTDGKYGYFVPYNNDSKDFGGFFGKVARVELSKFGDADVTIDVLDISNTPIRNHNMNKDETLKGFHYGFTDGKYGYFTPHHNQNGYFGKLVRVDLKDFNTVDVLDLMEKDPDLKGRYRGFTDGKYGYLVPYGASGKTARVNLQDFKTIDVLDLGDSPIKNRNYQKDSTLKYFLGEFTDGRYVYFVPYSDDSGFFGKIVRVDLCDFSTIEVLDLSLKDSSLKGFRGGFTDGKYGYLVPYAFGRGQYSGKVVRIALYGQEPVGEENLFEKVSFSSMVAAYEFNDNARDSSGNGRHGELIGSPESVKDRHGREKSAYKFVKDSGVKVPYNLLDSRAITISLWFKNEEAVKTTDSYNLFTTDGDRRFLKLGEVSSVLAGEIFGVLGPQDPNYPRSGVLASRVAIPAGWHHLVLRSSPQGHSYFLDGIEYPPDVLKHWTASSPLTPVNGATEICIGLCEAPTHPIIIDDVFFFKTALSDYEIRYLFER